MIAPQRSQPPLIDAPYPSRMPSFATPAASDRGRLALRSGLVALVVALRVAAPAAAAARR